MSIVSNNVWIYTAVITWWQHSGKTTWQPYIKKYFSDIWFDVHCCPEWAREIISKVWIPGIDIPVIDFQYLITEKQFELEKEYRQRALDAFLETKKQKNQLIVLDRWLLDTKAFLTQSEFDILAQKYSLDLQGIFTKGKYYDVIINLETSAIGTNVYTTDEARKEDKEQAITNQNKIKEVYASFNNGQWAIFIDNSTWFEAKMYRASAAVAKELGMTLLPFTL